jgi:hypothetical protein
LIHGPQHAETAAGQHEVDAIIEGEAKTSTQDDIDRLFA